MSLLLRGVCAGLQRCLMMWRWVWYNLRAFLWHRPAPISTKIYGQLHFSHLPCRITLGKGCGLGENVTLAPGREGEITLGESSTLNRGTMIVASQRVSIGCRVAVGEYVTIRDQQHHFTPGKGVKDQGYQVSPVEIGDFCWIGRGVFIGPGTRLGRNVIVGANSVVHGTFPDNVMIAGAPARIVKTISEVQAA